MNVEDGDELPIRVTFEESDGEYWHLYLAVLPRPGDTVIIASAPKGVHHRVKAIEHHVGSGNHRIVVRVERFLAITS